MSGTAKRTRNSARSCEQVETSGRLLRKGGASDSISVSSMHILVQRPYILFTRLYCHRFTYELRFNLYINITCPQRACFIIFEIPPSLIELTIWNHQNTGAGNI